MAILLNLIAATLAAATPGGATEAEKEVASIHKLFGRKLPGNGMMEGERIISYSGALCRSEVATATRIWRIDWRRAAATKHLNATKGGKVGIPLAGSQGFLTGPANPPTATEWVLPSTTSNIALAYRLDRLVARCAR